jgi:type IV secretory pathway VirB4 component
MEERTDKKERYRLDLGIQQDLNHDIPTIYKLKDRFTHTYILGKSEMGKSVLMERMAYEDIKQGISVIYIDPKGDSVKKLYSLCDNAKYISAERPLVLNPLDKKGYSIDNLIAEFVQVLDVLITLTSINPESSVRMKELINMALKSFTPEQMNLSYLADFLTYEETRKKHQFRSEDLMKYWREFDAKQGNFYKNRYHHDTAKSISSRLMQFINDEEMKKFVLGENEFSVSELLRNGQSLLVDTSQLRADKRIFVSNLIIYAVATYCQYEKIGIPLIVYIDEAQTCASHLFTDVLEFGRSARVGFVLAHHNFTQIKYDIINSIFGIVSNFIVFRCGDEEGKRMAEIYGLRPKDFYNLEKHFAWIRLGIDNTLIETYPPILKQTPDIEFKTEETPKYWFIADRWITF